MVNGLAVVGFWEVAQQTPLAVTSEPPSLVMLPPLVAVVLAMEDTVVVVRVAITAVVAKVNWLP